MELYKGSAQIGLLPQGRPLLQNVVQIDAVHCDLLRCLQHTAALLPVEGHEYRIACVAPVELACEEAFRLRESYLDAESAFIKMCGPGAASILRRPQYNPPVGAFVSIVQPGRYKHLGKASGRYARLVLRKHCALCGTQQRRSLPVGEVRCRFAQTAVRYSVYRHTLYAVVRSVAVFPEADVIVVAMLRLCHAEVGAVGRLHIIGHVADGTLHIGRRSERHPAVKRKIPLIEGRKRHPSEISPMRIALSCACMLRPRTVIYLTVRIVSVAEL